METQRYREVSVSLPVATVPAGHDGQSPMLCLNCRNPLDFHQPDAQAPDRILATCDECKTWHLIDANPDAGDVLVVLLPDVTSFRNAKGG